VTLLSLVIMKSSQRISRREGTLLLCAYVGYTVFVYLNGAA
jgi:Ca2+/Na+ antiporter